MTPRLDHTVLVVDDDADTREVVTLILESRGCRVHEAVHGQEALDLLRAGLRPSLILLDLMMPTMNGWEFREAQLADPLLAGIPTVVVSGAGHLRDQIADMKGVGRLEKPLELQSLVAAVGRHARRPD